MNHQSPWGITIASELSSLGSNLDPAMNCHPGISHAGQGITVCAGPPDGRKAEDPSIVTGLVGGGC